MYRGNITSLLFLLPVFFMPWGYKRNRNMSFSMVKRCCGTPLFRRVLQFKMCRRKSQDSNVTYTVFRHRWMKALPVLCSSSRRLSTQSDKVITAGTWYCQCELDTINIDNDSINNKQVHCCYSLERILRVQPRSCTAIKLLPPLVALFVATREP